AIIGSLVIVVLSLRSVKHLSHEVEEITEKNLDKILPVDEIDSELVGLAEAFNTTFKRLDDAFLLQRKFLSDASHELRTPISIIKSYCDITLKKERSVEEYRETVEVVDETIARMAVLVEKILDVARLETNGMVFKKESVDLSRVLQSVYKLIAPVSDEKGISMTLSGDEDSLELMGDEDRLSELFMNLIENGVKYNREGGTVDILCTSANGWIEVAVSDTGIGIPKEEQENIFNRFYRVDKSRSEITGAGLGLNIVKAIVDAHGGSIEVESEYGKGSKFTVRLPVNS
ncbi:MAG: sensor histidine kinase, partial [Thermodesulfobacteriota bacterium]